MPTSIDIKIKQDSLLLKELLTPPETGIGETVLFLDSSSKEIKTRAENNGEVKSLSATNQNIDTAEFLTKSDNLSDLQDVEAARTNLTAAKSGENLDIASLGSLNVPIAVNGNFNVPNTSRFAAYQSVSQSVQLADIYTKLELQAKDFDKLDEFADSKFTVKNPGVYLFNGAVGVHKPSASLDWRIILTMYVNGIEYARGNDLSLALPYGGTSANAIGFLNVDDYVELFLYTNYSCACYTGSAITHLTGIKIA